MRLSVRRMNRLATRLWRRDSRRRVVSSIGETRHRRARKRGSSLCDELADLAAALERMATRVDDALDRVIAATANSDLAATIARQFLGDIGGDPAQQITKLRKALRAYGVLLCLVNGRDLSRCRCLRDAVEDAVPGAVDSVVDNAIGHGFDSLVGA